MCVGVSVCLSVSGWEGSGGAPPKALEPAGGGQLAATPGELALCIPRWMTSGARRAGNAVCDSQQRVGSQVRTLPGGRWPAERRLHCRRQKAQPQSRLVGLDGSERVIPRGTLPPKLAPQGRGFWFLPSAPSVGGVRLPGSCPHPPASGGWRRTAASCSCRAESGQPRSQDTTAQSRGLKDAHSESSGSSPRPRAVAEEGGGNGRVSAAASDCGLDAPCLPTLDGIDLDTPSSTPTWDTDGPGPLRPRPSRAADGVVLDSPSWRALRRWKVLRPEGSGPCGCKWRSTKPTDPAGSN